MLNKKQFIESLSRQFPLFVQWGRGKFDGDSRWQTRKRLLAYYKNREVPQDMKEPIQFVKKQGVEVFPYYFTGKYDLWKVTVYVDQQANLKYVMHGEHRLYFPIHMDDFYIQKLYTSLLIEQDKESAHTYLSPTFDIAANDILLDIGAAEGIFSLSVVERVHKIYLFEVEEHWIAALKKTFEPWKDKVVIINKYVADKDSDTTIAIDSIADELDTKNVFLKIDVEGAEHSVLDGAKNILNSNDFNCKIALCTYHKPNDHKEFSALMQSKGYDLETSEGYMLFYYDGNLQAPFFRKAMLRCKKSDK